MRMKLQRLNAKQVNFIKNCYDKGVTILNENDLNHLEMMGSDYENLYLDAQRLLNDAWAYENSRPII